MLHRKRVHKVNLPARRLAGPGLRAFFRIMEAWQIEEPLQVRILGATQPTYVRWKRDPDRARLPRDTLERISYVLGIYKSLQILLPDPRIADRWVRQPNLHPLFVGLPPIARMGAGLVADLYVVREHLRDELDD